MRYCDFIRNKLINIINKHFSKTKTISNNEILNTYLLLYYIYKYIYEKDEFNGVYEDEIKNILYYTYNIIQYYNDKDKRDKIMESVNKLIKENNYYLILDNNVNMFDLFIYIIYKHIYNERTIGLGIPYNKFIETEEEKEKIKKYIKNWLNQNDDNLDNIDDYIDDDYIDNNKKIVFNDIYIYLFFFIIMIITVPYIIMKLY